MSSFLDRIIMEELHDGGEKIKNTIVKSMKHTKRAPWFYKRGNKIHRPSLAPNPPAVDSGNLWKSIIFNVSPNKLEVGALDNMAPYAKWLEGMTPSSTRRPTKRGEFTRPFLMPAVKKHKKDIIHNITNKVGKGIVLELKGYTK